MTLATSFFQDPDFVAALYIVAFTLFIIGLRGLAGPKTAPTGNKIAAVGMAIALVATLLIPGVVTDRMLEMFKGKRPEPKAEEDGKK